LKNLWDRTSEADYLVDEELRRATGLHGAFISAHEGYAVILEEMDELKAEVWKKQSLRDPAAMVREAVHVAAMATRFLVDIALPMAEREKKS
jgi:hypothetical protein